LDDERRQVQNGGTAVVAEFQGEPGDSDVEIAVDGEQVDEDHHQSDDERDDDHEEEPRSARPVSRRSTRHANHSQQQFDEEQKSAECFEVSRCDLDVGDAGLVGDGRIVIGVDGHRRDDGRIVLNAGTRWSIHDPSIR